MKVSIITIVLNDYKNIEKTILSVVNQDIKDLEYIVVDGGSTDGTLEIINKYKDDIDYVISEKDKGIVDAFNKGISLVTGDIIGLVNSGDFLEEGALSQVCKAFNDGTDIVYGDVQYWKKDIKDYIYSANHKYLADFMSLNHPSVFVKKELYSKYGLFDDTFKVAMDYELILRFYMRGATFLHVDTVLSNMALGGVSDVNWKIAYKEAYEIRKKYLGFSSSLYVGYLFQVLKRYISNILSKIGLEKVKVWYRQKFSKIKKSYDDTTI